MQESVHRLRNDYERCIDSYIVAKAKYEDQYTKGKMGKRLDDCKERYNKACRKLHSTHNEYILMLCEASEFERDLRTILLPGPLEYQQAVQEDMIDNKKVCLMALGFCHLHGYCGARTLLSYVISVLSHLPLKSGLLRSGVSQEVHH